MHTRDGLTLVSQALGLKERIDSAETSLEREVAKADLNDWAAEVSEDEAPKFLEGWVKWIEATA